MSYKISAIMPSNNQLNETINNNNNDDDDITGCFHMSKMVIKENENLVLKKF